MNRPNDPVAMKNPNWYSVNRKERAVLILDPMLIIING